MNAQLLIDNIIRQTTVLLAQLATSGGIRAPLAHIANDVFLNLARELDSQGVSRKVSADMFGLALRSYRRRIQRLATSSTERNRSLWEAVLDYLAAGELKSRREVLKRFSRDDETLVRGVLHDLCESGLVLRLGSESNTAYRAATSDELAQIGDEATGLEEWLWVTVYRDGPLTLAECERRVGRDPQAVYDALDALVADGRIQLETNGRYSTRSVVFAVQNAAGWEAALFDHFQAVVRTMCQRLRDDIPEGRAGQVGGSTYSFNIWPGHPLEDEVRSALADFRHKYTALRQRVHEHNRSCRLPDKYDCVTVYAGQSVISQEATEQEQGNDDEE